MSPSMAFPVLLLLLFGSGCAALVYEIVWLQMLEQVIGSTGVSLGILLGTFMSGLCLGSLLFHRWVTPAAHPFRVYAALEAAIGVLGVLVLLVVPVAGRLYAAGVATGVPGLLLRGLACAVLLLPPTILMGATLPAIARWAKTTPEGVSRLGFFYGGNILGAVFGCLLAGFYLLRVHDMATATWVAAGVNLAVAAVAWALAARVPHAAQEEPSPIRADASPRGATPILVAIALSGMTALGAQVVWTRILSLMLGATTYTFSIILAVVLIGLGIGSTAGAGLTRTLRRPGMALGASQLLLPLAIAWAAWMLADWLPLWPIAPTLSKSPWIDFQMDFVRCLVALLPATVLWGASFPFALAAATAPGQDPGRIVGRVFAANTLGALAGALLFSVVLVPAIGTQHSQRLMVGLAALAGVLALAPAALPSLARVLRPPPVAWAAAGAVALAAGLVATIGPVPPGLIAYGRTLATQPRMPDFLFVGEGMNSSVAVTKFPLAAAPRLFHVSGKVEASSEPGDMRNQRLLGHLPALVHGRPKSVLVVGFGAGVTAGSFVAYPEVERIVICEIEPLIPAKVGPHFTKENHGVLADPRVEIVYDDARHFLLTTKEKFDVITSDPIHPWVKGAASLYTQEYLELAKARLNPGGVLVEWVPLYENSAAGVKSLVATFFEVFPEASMWTHIVRQRRGDDAVIIGQAGPTRIDAEALEARFASPAYARVRQSLAEVGIRSPIQLFSGYTGRKGELGPWLAGAEINRDRNLRLQFLAGMGKYAIELEDHFEQFDRLRAFPDSLFHASDAWKEELRQALDPSRPIMGRHR
jgi:spermidine synthase